MKKLPESFGIMRDANNPLWDKYIAWLEIKRGRDIEGKNQQTYGLFRGKVEFRMSDNILTLEQWDSIVNGWKPKQGEIIEVSQCGMQYVSREFITTYRNEYLCIYPNGQFFSYRYARPHNPHREEIERLKARLKELEG